MRLRHLDYPSATPVDQLGLGALDALLDRGDFDDWAPLVAAVKADPNGPLADTILELVDAHHMYGTSQLWRDLIGGLRRSRDVEVGSGAGGGLGALRRARGMTQAQVAERLGASQSDVSKLEHRRDVKVSTLVAYAKATGGQVRVLVDYPDGTLDVLSGRPGGRRSTDRADPDDRRGRRHHPGAPV
ncbi:MAG: helix-turn-helix domain-containing protein [Acidimicrobiales bacterium]